jgi:hypothetical protein
MLKRLFRPNAPPKPTLSADRQLIQTLNQDLLAGYTPLALGELFNGWSLQVGRTPYDWHREGATLYRNGRPLMTDFRAAECFPEPHHPGTWILQGVLQNKPFRCVIRSSSLNRPWPYFESVNRVLDYWHFCLILEARRHPDWGQANIEMKGIHDEIHGLYFLGYAQLTATHCIVSCRLPERQRQAAAWITPTTPFGLSDDNPPSMFLDHIKKCY